MFVLDIRVTGVGGARGKGGAGIGDRQQSTHLIWAVASETPKRNSSASTAPSRDVDLDETDRNDIIFLCDIRSVICDMHVLGEDKLDLAVAQPGR